VSRSFQATKPPTAQRTKTSAEAKARKAIAVRYANASGAGDDWASGGRATGSSYQLPRGYTIRSSPHLICGVGALRVTTASLLAATTSHPCEFQTDPLPQLVSMLPQGLEPDNRAGHRGSPRTSVDDSGTWEDRGQLRGPRTIRLSGDSVVAAVPRRLPLLLTAFDTRPRLDRGGSTRGSPG
jgi:hypothetical protein